MALISASYQNQLETLHSSGVFGTVARAYAPIVAAVINKLEIAHVLDYGCGSNLSLAKAIHEGQLVKHNFKYQAYDPCVPAYAAPPVPAEMVACIDVLEHIEEDSIDEVLDHLQVLTEAVGVFSVDTGPAKKSLPDGRNAHVLQRPPEWWLPRIMCRFELQTYQVTWKSDTNPDHWKFYVVVNALPGAIQDTDGTKLSCQ